MVGTLKRRFLASAPRGGAAQSYPSWITLAGGLTVVLLLATACGDETGSTGGGASVSGSGAGTGDAGGGNQGAGGDNATSGSASGVGGDLVLTTSSGAGGAGGAPPCGSTLEGIVRDFQSSHPDFEKFLGDDKGIVTNELGMDGKPVYAGNPTTPTTSGKEGFDQWFRDVQGVNMSIPTAITLVPVGGGMYTYDNSDFFPIDEKGFGNEGNAHNFHFTLELRTQFEYKGGEVFKFTGDDDLFTYINGKLAMNLGGVHGAETQTVDLDAMASELGITKGKTYPLDFFFAERHTSESNFRIDTTISCFTSQPPPR